MINENTEDNDWKKDVPCLAAIGKNNPFTVPDHYFEGVTESVPQGFFLDSLKHRAGESAYNGLENDLE